MRAQIRAVDPEQPVAQIATAAELYQSLLAPPKFYASLMSAFAGLAVYMTALRGREFSIRIALGAEPRRIMSLVLRQGFGLAAAGAMIGVLVSLAAGRLLETLLVGVRPTNLATYAVVVTAAFAVTVLACWLPARRAGAVDPAIMLRAEWATLNLEPMNLEPEA